MPSGFLNLLKPPGMTSFDILRALHGGQPKLKLGHSGTLDLPACGVLVVAVERATRFLPYLNTDKEYLFEVIFGLQTDTGDLWGEIVKDTGAIVERTVVEEVLTRFIGDLTQEVPLFSAKHQDGKRLYQLAMAGREPSAQKTTKIHIYSLRFLDFLPGTYPRARLLIRCSGGTYVRTLAKDIGAALGLPACARFIIRLRSSNYRLEESSTLRDLESGPWPLLPIESALDHLPLEVIPERDLSSFMNGRAVSATLHGTGQFFRVQDRHGRFVGLGKRQEERLLVVERLP
ncbi:MAG: tRNA pseudouridine(55) synthase TruB [Coprothermobacterota bacterium]|nr:tRNA pseudouridine(55) synthase TruB [Coprothermobacterota bacterium]